MVPLGSAPPDRQSPRDACDLDDGPGPCACDDRPRHARLVWIGADDRGIELEIVALDLPDAIVVIHVMPTALRR